MLLQIEYHRQLKRTLNLKKSPRTFLEYEVNHILLINKIDRSYQKNNAALKRLKEKYPESKLKDWKDI